MCGHAVCSRSAGCGGDDDARDSGATGAQGASGAESASADITAEEFLAKLLPEKQVAIEAVVATEPECEGVKVEPSFVLVVSDAASNAEPGYASHRLVWRSADAPPSQKREPAATVDYTDPDGNVLTLRESLSQDRSGSQEGGEKGAGTVDDDWKRRTEMLFERLGGSLGDRRPSDRRAEASDRPLPDGGLRHPGVGPPHAHRARRASYPELD